MEEPGKEEVRQDRSQYRGDDGEVATSDWEGMEDDMSDEEEWFDERFVSEDFGNGADIY